MDTRSTERIAEVDGLRALAILGVLLWHYVGVLLAPTSPRISSVLALGRSGVDLFFVLSGFLIGSILIENRTAPRYFRTFYARRALRILPPYFGVVAAWLMGRHLGLPDTESPIPVWQYALFLQNFGMIGAGSYGTPWLGATWSLAIEEQFYLLCPLLVRILPTRSLKYGLAAMLLIAPCVRIASHRITGDSWFAYTALPARADALAAGILVAMAWRSWTARSWLTTNSKALALLLLSLAPGVLALVWAGPSSVLWVTAGHSLLLAVYSGALLLVLVARQRARIAWLTIPPLRLLASISYTTYLVHPIILLLASRVFRVTRLETPRDGLTIFGAFVATLAVAWLSYVLVERGLIGIGRQLSYGTASPSQSPGATDVAAASRRT